MPPKKHEDLGAGESAGLGRSSERQNRLAAGKIVNGIIDLVNQGAMHSLLARCAISYALDTLLKSQDVSHDKVMGESLVRLVLKGALAQGILSQEEALETSQISDLAETALPTALQSATENGILDDNTCLVGVLGLALQGALKEGNIPDRLAGYFKKAAQESTEDGLILDDGKDQRDADDGQMQRLSSSDTVQKKSTSLSSGPAAADIWQMPPKKRDVAAAGESATSGRPSERLNHLTAGKIVNGIVDLVNKASMHSLLARCAIAYALDSLVKAQDVSHDEVMGDSLVRLVLKGALTQGILSEEEAWNASQIHDFAEKALPSALQSATTDGILDDNTCLVGVLGLALQGALQEGNIPDTLVRVGVKDEHSNRIGIKAEHSNRIDNSADKTVQR
nr:hypothetical protein BaRGS_024646 [Batillaria attramentaria]